MIISILLNLLSHCLRGFCKCLCFTILIFITVGFRVSGIICIGANSKAKIRMAGKILWGGEVKPASFWMIWLVMILLTYSELGKSLFPLAMGKCWRGLPPVGRSVPTLWLSSHLPLKLAVFLPVCPAQHGCVWVCLSQNKHYLNGKDRKQTREFCSIK